MSEVESVIDSVRCHLMWYGMREGSGDCNYGSLRQHLKRSGVDTSIYPNWYRANPDRMHVNKGCFAELLYLTFKHAEASAEED